MVNCVEVLLERVFYNFYSKYMESVDLSLRVRRAKAASITSSTFPDWPDRSGLRC